MVEASKSIQQGPWFHSRTGYFFFSTAASRLKRAAAPREDRGAR